MTGTFPQRCHCCGVCGRVLPAHLSQQQCSLPVRFGYNKLKGKKPKLKTQIKGSFMGRFCHRDLENAAVPAFIVISICQICTGLLLFFVYMGLLKVSLVPVLGECRDDVKRLSLAW